MRAKDVRLHQKNVIDWGKWATGGKMPRSAFPLSKSKARAYRLGAAYRWRVIRFESEGEAFRVLIAFNPDKEQYRAILGWESGHDTSVVASYEFHGTHPGWHLLAYCDDLANIPPGVMRSPWQKRFPRPREKHRRTQFGINDETKALDVAAQFFRLHKKPGVLL